MVFRLKSALTFNLAFGLTMALQNRSLSSGVLGGGILGGGILGSRNLSSLSKTVTVYEEKQTDDNKSEAEEEDDDDVLESLPATIFGDNASKFICNQCSKVPFPAACCNQGHIFCKKCIMDLHRNNQLCPVDNMPITKPSLNQMALDSMIKKETVCCIYGSRAAAAAEADEGGGITKGGDIDDEDGCTWTGTVEELFVHLKTCPFRPVKCPFKKYGCQRMAEEEEEQKGNKLREHCTEYNHIHQQILLKQIQSMKQRMDDMQKEINSLRSMVGGGVNGKNRNGIGISNGPSGPSIVSSISVDGAPNGTVNDEIQRLWTMIDSLQRGNGSKSNHRRKQSANSSRIKPIDEVKEPMEGQIGNGMMMEDELVDSANNIVIGVGCNEKGDLGVGDDENIRSLGELSWSAGIGVERVVSCSYKAFCWITADQDVYVSGCNDYGQLGLNTEDDQWAAKMHPFFSGSNLKIVDVGRSINAFHTFFICSNGEIYCCGANEYGQLGMDDEENYTTPKLNGFFKKSNLMIKQIACGEHHSLFLTSDGQVYTCGLNESQQLGYETSSECQKKPKKVIGLKSEIIQVSAGRDHSFCLDRDGMIWSFGSNYRGQLGIDKGGDDESGDGVIHEIAWFRNQNKQIEMISSGNYHGAAVDKSGCVYVWGRGDEGQIGNGKKSDRFIPTMVEGFDNTPIVSIECGCHHTIAQSKDNKLYCWGNNRYNQCAETFTDSFDSGNVSQKVAKELYALNAQSTDSILAVIAGSYHTVLVLNKP